MLQIELTAIATTKNMFFWKCKTDILQEEFLEISHHGSLILIKPATVDFPFELARDQKRIMLNAMQEIRFRPTWTDRWLNQNLTATSVYDLLWNPVLS